VGVDASGAWHGRSNVFGMTEPNKTAARMLLNKAVRLAPKHDSFVNNTHNRPIWEQIALNFVGRGYDEKALAAYIVTLAIGM